MMNRSKASNHAASLEKMADEPPGPPLPREIRDLAEDQKICKYCGISYLILSEMRRVKAEMTALATKLRIYETKAQEHPALVKKTSEQEVLIKNLQERIQAAQNATKKLQQENIGFVRSNEIGKLECKSLKEKLVHGCIEAFIDGDRAQAKKQLES